MERRDDEVWRAIVENYGERAQLDDDPAPEGGQGSDGRGDTIERSGQPDGLGPAGTFDDAAPAPPPSPAGSPAGRAAEPAPEPDDRFVPPTPPPLPRPAPPRLAAWAGVLGMPVLVILLLVLQVGTPPWVTTGMVLWFLGGFAYLVASMPGERPDDDDNGARV